MTYGDRLQLSLKEERGITDDKTRLTHLYLLRTKDEAFAVYKEYEAWVATQLSAKINR